MKALITQEELKNVLEYNYETGIFKWIKPAPGRRKDKLAGSIAKSGYSQIEINNSIYYSHRLAWLYVHGKWPKYYIDHLNHKRSDNRLLNLREVKKIENDRNVSKRKDNTSGTTGVEWFKNKWVANIGINNKTIHLGRFYDINDAIACREEGIIKYNFHPNHGK
jgi:hypothetical protein